MGITNNLDSTRWQTFGYDQLNRVTAAQTTSTFSTSRSHCWGNLQSLAGGSSQYTGCTYETGFTKTADGNNHLSGFSYDAAGNLTSDGNNVYTYDAENRITQVNLLGTGGALVATYVYDADSHRIQKMSTVGNYSDPAGTWIFFYDLAGRWVQEFTSPANTFVRGNIYAGGRHLAFLGGGATTFSHSDWLGTERFRVGMGITPYAYESCSSLPFGDGLSCTNSDISPSHFTGKDRDAESGLDNFDARYNASSLGRFMSADPDNAGATLLSPQSWNSYSYVLNNPLKYVDPNGLDCVYFNDDGSHGGWIKQGDCKSETDNGYYVDGTINGAVYDRQIDLTNAGIAFDQDNNWATYTYKPYDAPFVKRIEGQCIGDCPNSAALVGVTLLPHSPAPWELGQQFNAKYSWLFGPAMVISGFTGLDPAYCGPMTQEAGAPEDSDHPKKQTQADEDLNNGKLVKDSRPKRPGPAAKTNRDGSQNVETASALAEAASLVNNGARCIANSRTQ
jgi:RHS repeat-associated protein